MQAGRVVWPAALPLGNSTGASKELDPVVALTIVGRGRRHSRS